MYKNAVNRINIIILKIKALKIEAFAILFGKLRKIYIPIKDAVVKIGSV